MKEMGQLIKDLEDLLSKKMSCKEFRDKYLLQNSPVDWTNLPNIIGNLDHYTSDEKTRSKDPEYAQMQTHELKKLIKKLKGNASEEELQEISFLGYSKD